MRISVGVSAGADHTTFWYFGGLADERLPTACAVSYWTLDAWQPQAEEPALVPRDGRQIARSVAVPMRWAVARP